MARIVETDVCILGGGITAAMAAEKLTEERDVKVIVIEAGERIFDFADRSRLRQRHVDYGENPYPGDHIRTMRGQGIQSRSMCVGGLAMHWGGTTPRMTPEDFRMKSLYGVGDDWPIAYEEVDPYYLEAEQRIGVAGTPGPKELDARSAPYPLPPLPLSYNLALLKEWGEKSGIPFWSNPVAKLSQPYRGRNQCVRCDTCNICPTGAKYSPDFTFQALLKDNRIELHDRTLVRRIVGATGSGRIEKVMAVNRQRPDDEIEYRAKAFVVAAGYAWSAHILLLSADSRYPKGVANSSGLVGKYLTGHRGINAQVEVPMKLYPGIYEKDSLLSTRYQRPGKIDKYVRHDLRIWESRSGREARLRDEAGKILLGDEVLTDWRKRTETGAARLRGYYDVPSVPENALVLDAGSKNEFGDPLPRIEYVDNTPIKELRAIAEKQVIGTFEMMVKAGGGKILSTNFERSHDHPGGGCRMGDDGSKSVVDRFGRTHDHDNLWVVGAPNLVTGGCSNGTLTFAALTLRSMAELGKEFKARQVSKL